MRHKTEVERSAIVKAVRDLLMVAFDEQTGSVITWGMVSDATSVTNTLEGLGYGKVTTQA
jgi:hypothetical protein